MYNYKITYKKENLQKTVTKKELFYEIQELFSNASAGFHKIVFNRIIDSPSFPYNHELVEIKTLNVKKSKKIIWHKKLEVPKNLNLKVGENSKYTEWIVYNNKTNRYSIFINLAALCRTLNIKYSYLYSRIKFKQSYTIGNLIFTCSTILQKDFYKNKIQEIL